MAGDGVICVWGRGRDIVNCLFIFRIIIHSTCNFAIPDTSIAGMRERGPYSVKNMSINHDQAHTLVV